MTQKLQNQNNNYNAGLSDRKAFYLSSIYMYKSTILLLIRQIFYTMILWDTKEQFFFQGADCKLAEHKCSEELLCALLGPS